jgi:tripartite-type tricarboxylate transporter receptor subunit TctC
MFRSFVYLLFGIATLASVASAVNAQRYPEKPIRLIVPFAPGGNIDITARTISPGISEALGTPVVVENRGGASGTIGVDMTAKAPADGYTLVVGSTGTITGAPSVFPKLPYDPLKDLAPISMINDVPIVVVVHPALRAKNMRELVQFAKQQAGRMTMGSPGVGSTNHLAGELFQISTGTRFTHVPYKGSGPALIDLMGGQIDLYFDQLTSSIGYMRANKLRGIGVAQLQRSGQIPEVPTLAEQGCKGCEASTFAGLFAAAATPRAIVDRLADVTAKVVGSKVVQDRFASLGAEAKASKPDEFAKFVRADVARWQRIVKEAGIKFD